MGALSREDTGIVSTETRMQFSHKSLWDHAVCVLAHWPSLLLTALAVFGALWTVVAASSYFLDVSLRGWGLFAITIALALSSASCRAIYAYHHGCPEGLEDESSAARRIAQIQRPKWEFHLARRLLDDKLRGLDRELKDIIERRVFIPIDRRLSATDYMDWVETRPESALRMIDGTQQLLVVDFPLAIASQKGRPADPSAILSVVNRIRDLYAESVAFERATHAVAPPNAFQAAHALQVGWTDPIRNGVQQLLQFLDTVLTLDPRSDHEVSFKITYGEPPNVVGFCKELARLQREVLG